MEESIQYISFDISENDEEKSEAEDSDDGLKLVIESPQNKRKNRLKELEISPNDKAIIKTVENDLEKRLEEKAAKANLTTLNVRNILKHVVTNEHVLAMVRQTEDPENHSETLPVFEPKLTRAKAKELYSNTNLPWITPTQPSEVQVLIGEELQEDSSGDEYVPHEEESEDDKDNSILSESDPPTPKNTTESSAPPNWTDDGIFKIPPIKTKEMEEEANIAKRTRSKLSLSSTPLEIIEEAFDPPDITTDMYDMVCDDEDWSDFLKQFTRPLDEVTKDDEDHDPEYNVLADEEIDKVDKEELRADKAVKVTRKELNELLAELFDCDDFLSRQDQPLINFETQPQFTIMENGVVEQTQLPNESVIPPPIDNTVKEEFKLEEVMMTDTQKILLNQQMRQHVQMLTQNFILGYEHPEYFEIASKCKEYIMNLRCLSGNNESSHFLTINLHAAIDLIEYWEKKFESNDEEVSSAKAYVAKVYHDCKAAKISGNEYIPTFPKLILDTILKSTVFLYPALLPKIPFKPTVNNTVAKGICKSETQLIALGLEQFIPLLLDDPHHVASNGKVRMKHLSHYIQRYMMPIRDYTKIQRHITSLKNPRAEPNPIQYYYQNNKAPVTVHYVVEVNQLGVFPPCERKVEELPYQWKQYLYSKLPQQQTTSIIIPIIPSITKICKPPSYKSFISKKKRILPKQITNIKTVSHKISAVKRRIKFDNEPIHSFNDFRNNNILASTPIGNTRKLEEYFVHADKSKTFEELNFSKLKFNSTIFKNLKSSKRLKGDMLPSMPSLTTPFKKTPERCISPPNEIEENLPSIVNESEEIVLDVKENVDEKGDNKIETDEKDNIDDINNLMVASSTIKPVQKKKTLSSVEKKKAKLKKDLNTTLSILAPEDEAESEEKTNRYVQAFYDKLQERLDIHEYHKLIEILNNFEENHDSVVDLYKNVNDILNPKYTDLTDEFLSFLTSAQAKAVGKLVPHIMISNMALFLRKLEMYFKGQPFQVKKIYSSVTELADCVDITMDRVKSTILPLLKGNKLLIDWFLQIFPCETPTQSLLNGTWESVEVGKDNTFNTNAKEDIFETVVVPEVEDPYGGPNCICSCHKVEEQAFKSRQRHCIPCGTKFLQGRVYVHTGKGLRLAKVSFNNSSPNIDQCKRLACQSSIQMPKRRSEISPSKHIISPSKDTQEDVRMSNESEDDDCAKKKLRKLTKTPRKRRTRPKTEKCKKDKKSLVEGKVTPLENSKMKIVKLDDNPVEFGECEEEKKFDIIDQGQENVSDSSLNDPKLPTEEVMEWDCNTSIESVELKLSPEPSAESESGETSQDNLNTDSDCSAENICSPANIVSENSNSNTAEELSWTREEDKIILETFRREGEKEETFQHIARLLENRTVSKVKSRFQTLLNILQEMAAKKVL